MSDLSPTKDQHSKSCALSQHQTAAIYTIQRSGSCNISSQRKARNLVIESDPMSLFALSNYTPINLLAFAPC